MREFEIGDTVIFKAFETSMTVDAIRTNNKGEIIKVACIWPGRHHKDKVHRQWFYPKELTPAFRKLSEDDMFSPFLFSL